MTNIFTKIMTDAASGHPYGVFSYSDRRKKGEIRRQTRLIVRRGVDDGKGYDRSFRYDIFEEAFFRFVDELDPRDFDSAAGG